LSRTVEAADNRRALAADASLDTFRACLPQCHVDRGTSMTPTSNIALRMRVTESSTAARVTVLRSRAVRRRAVPKNWSPGISMSRPCISDAECVAPQSDMTKPWKPSLPFRSWTRAGELSQAHTPLTLL